MTDKAVIEGRRASLLRAMGLTPLWQLRNAPQEQSEHIAAKSVVQPAPAESQPAGHGVVASPSPVSAMNDTRPTDARVARIATLSWDELAAEVAGCQACVLCQLRRQAVLGVGDRQADWLFVGEGPGEEEDKRGEPFVGPAGKLLDAMLAAIGLKRGADVYIANAVKCRPPGNRNPTDQEVAACRPFLERQITLLQPRLIVALGRPAVQALLGHEVKIASMRGRLHRAYGRPLIVTYHPAYLLRTPQDKAKAWEDLCFARRTMRELKAAG